MDHPPALVAPPRPDEASSLPALVEARPDPVEAPSVGHWASFEPGVQAFGPVAAHAVGRALIDSWDPSGVSDPTVLDQVALQAVTAAAAVAADPGVDGRDRASAVADGRAVFAGLAAAHDRADGHRAKRADRLLLGALLATVAGVVAAWLGRRPR